MPVSSSLAGRGAIDIGQTSEEGQRPMMINDDDESGHRARSSEKLAHAHPIDDHSGHSNSAAYATKPNDLSPASSATTDEKQVVANETTKSGSSVGGDSGKSGDENPVRAKNNKRSASKLTGHKVQAADGHTNDGANGGDVNDGVTECNSDSTGKRSESHSSENCHSKKIAYTSSPDRIFRQEKANEKLPSDGGIKQERPSSNLMKRDGSWQSNVSLTRISMISTQG